MTSRGLYNYTMKELFINTVKGVIYFVKFLVRAKIIKYPSV